MSELFKIVLTSSLTVLGGILVFVVGRIIEKFAIEPIHKQSRLIGEIADSLIFYADLYSNPGIGKREQMDEAKKVLREQASQLIARNNMIPCYKFWRCLSLGHLPKRTDVIEARHELIGLSNSIHQGDGYVNAKRRKEIEKRLGIKTDI